jgi:fructuronate reductase
VRPAAPDDRPLVVMGVAGSGKSTIAAALARQLGREFRDGDSFHSPGNVAKMARGEALTDDDRLPWLDSIAAWLAASPGRIVACSALRKSYRDRLRVAGPLLFLYLDITPSTARQRVAGRHGHFMPASLIDDQFATLERPAGDEPDVRWLDAEAPRPILMARALSAVVGARTPAAEAPPGPAPRRRATTDGEPAVSGVARRPLSRAAAPGRPAAPVRILHLGLGNFFRAHQAWYTHHAPDAAEWGIAAFTGRRPGLARILAAQDGLYTLAVRGADGDRREVIRSLSAAHPGADHAAWLDYWRLPGLGVVTLTITEAGYARVQGTDVGGLDTGRADVLTDIAALRASSVANVRTAPAKLLSGLAARREAGLPPVVIVPCDNLPGNAEVARRVVRDLAEAAGDPGLIAAAEYSLFATTMVDRITPAATRADLDEASGAGGFTDAAPVVTEPFSEWVLSGRFPAGRPRWEDAGARFVSDVGPFELRKLWLLNGAHSLFAYTAPLLGHATVAEAAADPHCREWLALWWEEASRHLPMPMIDLTGYQNALLERFANPRIRHTLTQIAADGSQKLPVRILPALRAERAAGRLPHGAAHVLSGWLLHLRGHGAPIQDAGADPSLAEGPLPEAARRVLAFLDPPLADDAELAAAVTAHARALEAHGSRSCR